MSPSRIALCGALLLMPAAVQAAAGQVLFALGRVEIERGGQALAAARGMPVEVGDTIRTGPTGLAQVRLQDGALLSLRYGSTMSIDDFRMPQPAPAAAAATAATPQSAAVTGGRAALRLLRGAFRTVTGLIGRGSTDAYSVTTPVATIGIRGTDYSAAYCNGDCGSTPDGLYAGVSNGAIAISNDGGTLLLTNDQYGYVKDLATPPARTLAPPEVLDAPTPPDDEGDGETGGDEPGGGDEPPPSDTGARDDASKSAAGTGDNQPEGDYELRPGAAGRFAFATTGFQGAGDTGVYTDSRGALVGFLRGSFASIGTAANTDLGADAATGLRWGRWTGGVANVGNSSVDLTSQSLHWIYATGSSAPQLPISGTASYRLVGNTSPTDNLGNVGFLGDATLNADFTNQTVFSTVNVGINDQVWIGSGSGSLASGTALFSGSYAVTVNDASGAPFGSGSGSYAGFFTDFAAGAGLSFSLTSSGATVSGAAGFERVPGGP